MNAPYYLLRGGSLYDSSVDEAGFAGYYWSSTPLNSARAYALAFHSSYVGASGGSYRNASFSVRCVAAQ